MDNPTRRDAARNRERLVSAARRAFMTLGPDVPLEEIAKLAEVSRTTLHRHFADREALASAVLEHNVDEIEARATALAGTDDGAERLYHYLLDVQLESPWLSRIVATAGDPAGLGRLGELADRTAAALEPLLAEAHERGRAHRSVTIDDVLVTLPMAMAAQGPGVRRERGCAHVRAVLHRGLFTTEPPAGS
ncbi:TetR/AcrR family transcriptional regulator [Rhodococcus sp. HNM0569]|uniref:TetR/AcrR family transcriptional regulator n=1 Tax=Rhodococcus sp. HNM0569 TaxID=2716340 RepID=UPI00146AE8D5|nr:TetR/AcrR family transcriptional regulator [Rhodococcus sp. HNM0569]NLU82329.1 TetR/AcrR family transcriptional regulator [Rhodococcus sp. HNM0569]